MDDFRIPDDEDLTEDWAHLFADDPPKPADDGVNWDDYNFNFDDEFGPVEPQPAPQPAPQPGRYSVDAMRRLHESGARYGSPAAVSLPQEQPWAAPAPQRGEKPPRRKKKHRVLRLLIWLLVILLVLSALAAAALLIFTKQPKTDQPIGERRKGCSVILLAGVDKASNRTDTLMLLYLDRPGKTMRLLSIPRDTMVNRDNRNNDRKINGAYYANGVTADGFEEALGMDYLMGYVQDVVGYRPDGYVLIDLDCFEELVDLMGGVRFNVPMDMHYEDPAQDLYIDLSQGEQTLSGRQAMWLVRFRSGYAMADLERVNVQRSFLSAAASQWASVRKLPKLPAALRLLTQNTVTDLSRNELLWIAESVVLCRKNFESNTLPGSPQMVSGAAYYVEDVQQTAALVNDKYNPYKVEITADMLHPYGK